MEIRTRNILFSMLVVLAMFHFLHFMYENSKINLALEAKRERKEYRLENEINAKNVDNAEQNKKMLYDNFEKEQSESDEEVKAMEEFKNRITGNSVYDGHDLLKDPTIEFDKNFKNPCWWQNQNLKCLPYVYIIGAKKCGTSDLAIRLGKHPDFARPGFKEAQWFARKRFSDNPNVDDVQTYVNMFDKAAKEIIESGSRRPDGTLYNDKTITGEASPSNLHLNTHWQSLPGNEGVEEPRHVILDYIHHYLPNARLIITFRDPIERLYSDYYHEYGSLRKTNDPNPYQFHMVVAKGIQMYKDCFNRYTVRSCVYNHTLYDITLIQMQLGIYYVFWEDLLRVFPREHIHVVQNKEMRDKEKTISSIYDFLGLRKLTETEMEVVVNATEGYTRRPAFKAKGPMLNITRDLLYDFYQPFNIKMAEITGNSVFLYKPQ